MQLWVVIALWATAGFAVAVVLERVSSKSFVWLKESFEYERRNLDAEASDRAHSRWLSLVQPLDSLRHLQRLFAYTGHHLQTFPKSLRDRIKTL